MPNHVQTCHIRMKQVDCKDWQQTLKEKKCLFFHTLFIGSRLTGYYRRNYELIPFNGAVASNKAGRPGMIIQMDYARAGMK